MSLVRQHVCSTIFVNCRTNVLSNKWVNHLFDDPPVRQPTCSKCSLVRHPLVRQTTCSTVLSNKWAFGCSTTRLFDNPLVRQATHPAHRQVNRRQKVTNTLLTGCLTDFFADGYVWIPKTDNRLDYKIVVYLDTGTPPASFSNHHRKIAA